MHIKAYPACEKASDRGDESVVVKMNSPINIMLPDLIRLRAAENHPRPFASIPASGSLGGGFQDISYTKLSRAVENVSRIIEDSLSTDVDGLSATKTFAYVGPNNLGYQIVILAAMETGHQALLMEPGGGDMRQVPLLQDAGCSVIVLPGTPSEAMKKAVSSLNLKVVIVPKLDELLSNDSQNQYPVNGAHRRWRKTLRDQGDALAWMQLHSSTKTIKKPQSRGYFSNFGCCERVLQFGSPSASTGTMHSSQYESSPNWCRIFKNRRFLSSFPIVHGTALQALVWSILLDATMVLPRWGRYPKFDVIQEAHKFGKVNISFLSLTTIEEMFKARDHIGDLTCGGTVQVIGFEVSNRYRWSILE